MLPNHPNTDWSVNGALYTGSPGSSKDTQCVRAVVNAPQPPQHRLVSEWYLYTGSPGSSKDTQCVRAVVNAESTTFQLTQYFPCDFSIVPPI